MQGGRGHLVAAKLELWTRASSAVGFEVLRALGERVRLGSQLEWL
jgi:hypothetical protein